MLGASWGATAEEWERTYPCDRSCAAEAYAYLRAVTVRAPAEVLFLWLCQLRVAPYSYDWLDNLGRRSPQRLTPGLEALAVGQTMMTIFDLKEFEPGRSLTVVNKQRGGVRPVFGEVWVSYVITPLGGDECRLAAKLRVVYPRGVVGRLMRAVLPPGDLVMMRRQLLNLKRLAERDARATVLSASLTPGSRPRT